MGIVREISEKSVESENEGDGAESEDGEAEVVALAKRCLEIGNGGKVGSYNSSDKT